MLRLTANLFFGNAGAFRDEFYSHISDADNDIKAVIVDAQVHPTHVPERGYIEMMGIEYSGDRRA